MLAAPRVNICCSVASLLTRQPRGEMKCEEEAAREEGFLHASSSPRGYRDTRAERGHEDTRAARGHKGRTRTQGYVDSTRTQGPPHNRKASKMSNPRETPRHTRQHQRHVTHLHRHVDQTTKRRGLFSGSGLRDFKHPKTLNHPKTRESLNLLFVEPI